ncbi:hypothetical protein KY290_001128 [Solanum tuberosum]|uniref:Integrase catalytic domain-containing protein n=1 Tax=Solanum tuberosum TaxID=4113 RepID=A0ABQ7WNJ0_SOLTU|nr:hypothetical protein KY290_001128 [Solanum tuberosum]
MGYDFTVEYRAGCLNKAADALSRMTHEDPSLNVISSPRSTLLDTIREELTGLSELLGLYDKVKLGDLDLDWQVYDGLLLFKGRIYLLQNSPLLPTILYAYHDSAHEGIQKMLHKIRGDFYWKGMKTNIAAIVVACPVCQCNKFEHLSPAGLLQPLHLPTQILSDISMDFIDGLPKSWGKSVVFVLMDRFSKYAHFIPLAHPYIAARVAQVFFEQIVRLHGIPETITCDRDVVFTSTFWKELFLLNGTKRQFSSAYHPQTNGQTEVVNRTVEMYLCCFVGTCPRKWVAWVPWEEFCYNISFHSTLQTTPFKVVYGRDPPRLLSYVPGTTRVEVDEHALLERDHILGDIQIRLQASQQRMKEYYDKGHRDVKFSPGSLVWLRLHPYRQRSMRLSIHNKLSHKFYGSFSILRRIRQVAYELDLPNDSRIHNVFHVSLLKAFKGDQLPPITELPTLEDGKVVPLLAAVIRALLNCGTKEILIQWSGMTEDEAT